MMPEAIRAPVRYLIIVAHEHADLVPVAARRFAGDPNVEVLVDRRRGERRRHAQPVPWDRRRRQRRAVSDFWADLRFHPVVLATRREGIDVQEAPIALPAPPPAGPDDAQHGALRDILLLCQRVQAVLEQIRTRLAPPAG